MVLNTHEVQDITGLSRTTIWRLERSGDFPARVTLCPGRVGWRHSDVMEWMHDRYLLDIKFANWIFMDNIG